MQRHGMARLAAAALACVPALSWAQMQFGDPRELSMAYEEEVRPGQRPIPGAPQAAAAPALPRLTCKPSIGKIEDLRRNKATAGAWLFMFEAAPGAVPLAGASLVSGDGSKWLKGAVESLRPAGLVVQGAAAPDAVDVSLRLAHSWTSGMNIHSHVVLQVDFPRGGQRRYHGFASKLNFAGGTGEFMSALNMGMGDALRQVVADLQRVCEGREPATPAPLQASVARPPAAPAPAQAVAAAAAPAQARQGLARPAFEYKLTNRASNSSRMVSVRGDGNDGLRLGELDLVTPPGGWEISGTLSHDFSSGPGRQYSLTFEPAGEETLILSGRDMKTQRVQVAGWVRTGGQIPANARYVATAWYSPELKRVVRFDARARSSGSAALHIDEQTELVSAP
jgi:hypothetical protein